MKETSLQIYKAVCDCDRDRLKGIKAIHSANKTTWSSRIEAWHWKSQYKKNCLPIPLCLSGGVVSTLSVSTWQLLIRIVWTAWLHNDKNWNENLTKWGVPCHTCTRCTGRLCRPSSLPLRTAADRAGIAPFPVTWKCVCEVGWILLKTFYLKEDRRCINFGCDGS